MPAQRIPFTWQDQTILDLESASDPWNIQFEIVANGELDVDRVRTALAAACARHLMARARMLPRNPAASENVWEVTDLDGLPPVDVGELDRTAFYSPRIPLDRAPAFRARVVRDPAGDRLMLAVAHTVVDGIGLLRLIAPLPIGVKKVMPHLLTLTGNRFVDSAVVSNLGRHHVLPSFDDGDLPADLAFTPPYWSAAAVSVGAISVGNRLHLGLRHRLTTLDEDAGREFAQLLVDELI